MMHSVLYENKGAEENSCVLYSIIRYYFPTVPYYGGAAIGPNCYYRAHSFVTRTREFLPLQDHSTDPQHGIAAHISTALLIHLSIINTITYTLYCTL